MNPSFFKTKDSWLFAHCHAENVSFFGGSRLQFQAASSLAIGTWHMSVDPAAPRIYVYIPPHSAQTAIKMFLTTKKISPECTKFRFLVKRRKLKKITFSKDLNHLTLGES